MLRREIINSGIYLTEDCSELTHEVMHSLCSNGFSTRSLLLDLPDPNNMSRGGVWDGNCRVKVFYFCQFMFKLQVETIKTILYNIYIIRPDSQFMIGSELNKQSKDLTRKRKKKILNLVWRKTLEQEETRNKRFKGENFIYRVNPLHNLFDSLLDGFGLDRENLGFSGGYITWYRHWFRHCSQFSHSETEKENPQIKKNFIGKEKKRKTYFMSKKKGKRGAFRELNSGPLAP